MKSFQKECSHIKNQYQLNRCRDVEVLLLMDKLSSSENLQEVIDLADKTTKTCQKNHLLRKHLDYYPMLISDCIVDSLRRNIN